MAHTLYKLRSKVFNTPQLMNLPEFENVVHYLNERCDGGVAMEGYKEEDQHGRYSYNSDVQAAVINLVGASTYRPTFWSALCGGFDYQTLKEDFTYLAEQGVKTVAFHVDSPGGEAHAMMDTANYLRTLADKHGIRLVGYADGQACSAGYGLLCICDEIYMSSDSEVGSVGVVVRLINDHKALEKEGYQRTFITAGESKVPFDSGGEFTEDFISDLQFKVDSLYKDFTEHVAKHRNMSVETVRSTEAKTFLPDAAIELGLADGVKTVEQFYTYLADVAQRQQGTNMFKKPFLTKEDTTEMSKIQELEGEITTLKAQLADTELATKELLAAKEQLTEMEGNIATLEASLKEAQAKLESAAQEKADMKTAARKEKLAAVLDEQQVEAVAPALLGLEDGAFDAVLASYASTRAQLETSSLFVEMGGTGAEEEPETQKEDTTTKLLKAKFA